MVNTSLIGRETNYYGLVSHRCASSKKAAENKELFNEPMKQSDTGSIFKCLLLSLAVCQAVGVKQHEHPYFVGQQLTRALFISLAESLKRE